MVTFDAFLTGPYRALLEQRAKAGDFTIDPIGLRWIRSTLADSQRLQVTGLTHPESRQIREWLTEQDGDCSFNDDWLNFNLSI